MISKLVGNTRMFLAGKLGPVRAAVLASSALLMIPGVVANSVTSVEFCQLPAGLDAWQRRAFGVYRVCGPSSKMLYAMPAQLGGVRLTHPASLDNDPVSRREWEVGLRFQEALVHRYFDVYRWSRLLPMLLTLGCGCLICWWSTRLFGNGAGLVSLCAWCWLPPVLAHGSLVTSDVPAAFAFLLASICFWRYLLEPQPLRATAAGLALGLAVATKYTLLILAPCWALLLAVRAMCPAPEGYPGRRPRSRRTDAAIQVLCLCLSALFALNALYTFEGMWLGFEEWDVRQSAPFREVASLMGGGRTGWLLHVPLPLPREFARGLDAQLANTEIPQPGYLWGAWRPNGFWYWYPGAALIKIPASALLLMAVASWATVRERRHDPAMFWAALCSLFPAANLSIVVASTTGTGNNAAFRYMIPTIATLCVWMGRAWSAGTARRLATLGLLAWLTVTAAIGAGDFIGWQSSLGQAFSPQGRPALVGDSLDWGQDLARLGRWVAGHASEGSTWVCVYGQGKGEPYGLRAPIAHTDPDRGAAYLAVSENILAGLDDFQTVSIDARSPRITPNLREWIAGRTPVDRVGRSIRIYRVTHADHPHWYEHMNAL